MHLWWAAYMMPCIYGVLNLWCTTSLLCCIFGESYLYCNISLMHCIFGALHLWCYGYALLLCYALSSLVVPRWCDYYCAMHLLVHCFLVLGAIYFWCCVFGAMHGQLHRAALLPQWRIYYYIYWMASALRGCHASLCNAFHCYLPRVAYYYTILCDTRKYHTIPYSRSSYQCFLTRLQCTCVSSYSINRQKKEERRSVRMSSEVSLKFWLLVECFKSR